MPDETSVLNEAKALSGEFEKLEGRRPRILLSGLGLSEAEDQRKIIATIFSNMGWDVDMGPVGETPAAAAQGAVDNDVHLVGFFSMAAGYKTLLPALVEELKAKERDDILTCVFGPVPAEETTSLYEEGVVAIFRSGTDYLEGCLALLQMMVEGAREEAREG